MRFYSVPLSKGIKTIRDGEAAHAETSVLDFTGFDNPIRGMIMDW